MPVRLPPLSRLPGTQQAEALALVRGTEQIAPLEQGDGPLETGEGVGEIPRRQVCGGHATVSPARVPGTVRFHGVRPSNFLAEQASLLCDGLTSARTRREAGQRADARHPRANVSS